MGHAVDSLADGRFEGMRVVGECLATTEVRWFGSGPPPASVVAWFSEGGKAASVELRRDTYRVSSSHEAGLKRRDHGPLEVKLRHGVAPRRNFPVDLTGRVEEWRKHRLEEPLHPVDWRWSQVDKVVLTRTLALDPMGGVAETQRHDLSAPGCDIELATVTRSSMEAWTFAIEAWGEPHVRLQLIDRSFVAMLELLPPPPRRFGAALEVDMGYPEWLAATAETGGLVRP